MNQGIIFYTLKIENLMITTITEQWKSRAPIDWMQQKKKNGFLHRSIPGKSGNDSTSQIE
jgi:hypothetical protein